MKFLIYVVSTIRNFKRIYLIFIFKQLLFQQIRLIDR